MAKTFDELMAAWRDEDAADKARVAKHAQAKRDVDSIGASCAGARKALADIENNAPVSLREFDGWNARRVASLAQCDGLALLLKLNQQQHDAEDRALKLLWEQRNYERRAQVAAAIQRLTQDMQDATDMRAARSLQEERRRFEWLAGQIAPGLAEQVKRNEAARHEEQEASEFVLRQREALEADRRAVAAMKQSPF